MRRIRRATLDDSTRNALARKQSHVNSARTRGDLNVEQEWENARRTKPLKAVLTALKNMINARERCMYCLDSHGTDIEHFWPKSQYPERMFIWLNLLLSCAECQRIKGSQFPTASGNNPLLIDPTAEQPWDYLDFDPITGNLVARFDPVQDGYCSKGIATVETLQLDKREALAAGYKKTYRRLANLINEYLESALACSQKFVQSLFEADEHGLLGWCFHGNGQKEAPFSKLRSGDPETWSACIRLIGS